MSEAEIPAHFIQYAADILGDTKKGLSGPNIVKATAAYAVEYDNKRSHRSKNFLSWFPIHRTMHRCWV